MFGFRGLVLACALVASAPASGRAEDGYELWLRYGRVADAARLAAYPAAISSRVMPGTSPTLRAARDELVVGLSGLLGRPIAVRHAPVANGTLLVGTPASSRPIAALPLAAALRSAGPDGFVIRAMTVNGRPAIVLAANRDIGVLYGAFHLLRVLQTNGALGALAVTSAPMIQLRMLDHWDNLD